MNDAIVLIASIGILIVALVLMAAAIVTSIVSRW